MKIDRDVVIDLLPVYFSGEASAATKALVEDCFREDPDLERIARSANKSVELLKDIPVSRDQLEEKVALELARERARVRAEAWHTSGLSALIMTMTAVAFQVRDHKLVFLMWQKTPIGGFAFAALACILWFVHWLMRGRYALLSKRVRLWLWAIYFTVCPALLLVNSALDRALKRETITASTLVWIPLVIVAAGWWIAYFMERRKEYGGTK